MLEKRVKRQLLEEVRSICPKNVTIMHVRQGNAKGLGHAVLCGRPLVGNEPFAVMLPDVLLAEFSADQKKENLAAMIQRFNETGASQIMVTPVPQENVSSYGVADCGGIELNGGESAKINSIVENLLLKTHHQILQWLGVMFFQQQFGTCWKKHQLVLAMKSN